MIKFIDLNTGYIFDGNKPYIFWFENGQSIDIVYTKSIGVISDLASLDVSMPKNSIFSLLNPNQLIDEQNINGFKYHEFESIKCDSYTSIGTSYGDKYIHVIYISANSKDIGEFVGNFNINNTSYNIGADFYNEEESLYINLSNFGVEIPESIQKTIYESNVHEDKKDNILLNRKFKELLVNYWDVIANKGSYKSLINSIKWFEYGDILKLREIWRKESQIKPIFEDREISSIMKDKYIDTIYNYTKTTYYALYIQQNIIDNTYDTEQNPNIIPIEYKWPLIDIMIKISLLGHFYETYFMPVHLDLIHSTIENIVFSNTIKFNKGTALDRLDNIYNFTNVNCNIKEGDQFVLSNVSCQVNNMTQLSSDYTMTNNIIGVDDVIDTIKDDNDLKNFYNYIYNGVGCIVPVSLSFNLNNRDFIKNQSITFIHDNDNDWKTYKQYKIYRPNRSGKVNIDFKLLCTKEKEYDIRLSFEAASGEMFTKNIKFNTVSNYIPTLNIYKIVAKNNPTLEDLYTKPLLYNSISRQPIQKYSNTLELPHYTQYLTSSKESLKLNHMLVVTDDNSQQIKLYLDTYYYSLDLGKNIDGKHTTIYISKNYKDDSVDLVMKSKLMNIKYIQNRYTFIPQFHELVPFNGESINDYIITDDTLCCIPDIKYGLKIDDYEWEFENISNNTSIKLPSIRDVLISNTQNSVLTNGFYNIIFRYSLSDGETNEIKLNSAFIKK